MGCDSAQPHPDGGSEARLGNHLRFILPISGSEFIGLHDRWAAHAEDFPRCGHPQTLVVEDHNPLTHSSFQCFLFSDRGVKLLFRRFNAHALEDSSYRVRRLRMDAARIQSFYLINTGSFSGKQGNIPPVKCVLSPIGPDLVSSSCSWGTQRKTIRSDVHSNC